MSRLQLKRRGWPRRGLEPMLAQETAETSGSQRASPTVTIKRKPRREGVAARGTPENGKLAHWRQSNRWFWFGSAELGASRLLVVPTGETFEQGPHQMTRFRTQDGVIQTCSVAYFEAHTVPAQGMRPVKG